VSEDIEKRRQHRSQVAAVTYELYKEKHVLRQMRGRRLDEHCPPSLCATSDPDQPVILDGGWQRPSAGETEKHSLIRHLQVTVSLALLIQYDSVFQPGFCG